MNIFSGRKMVIATMHGKEQVIAPAVASALEVFPFVPKGLDTDQFGTFTGEIERKYSPLETARIKCEAAMNLTDCDMAIASEGSFGPHPLLFFAACNEEWVLLVDRKNRIEITGRKLSTDTNYDYRICYNVTDLLDFAAKSCFPKHGLILRKSKSNSDLIFKGIIEQEELIEKFMFIYEKYGQVFVETDMRALYNPKRMQVIAEATSDLVDKATSFCKKCRMPGFGITASNPGLICSLCGMPTKSILSHIWSCNNCGHSEEKISLHKTAEDPMYCDICNP
jgi:hypothetical protein